MKSDRARYDDGEEIPCRTCGTVLSYPSAMVDDLDLNVHHPSCTVPRKIRCDAAAIENSDDIRSVCCLDASSWDVVNNLCYCDNHQAEISGLQPITEMTKETVAVVLARQKVELG